MEISGPTPLPSRANLDQVAQALSGWVLNNSKDGVSQLLGAPVPVFHSTHCEKKFPNLSLEFPFFQLVSIASHPFTFHLMLAKAAYTFWFWSECPYLWVMMVFHTLSVAMAINFFVWDQTPMALETAKRATSVCKGWRPRAAVAWLCPTRKDLSSAGYFMIRTSGTSM